MKTVETINLVDEYNKLKTENERLQAAKAIRNFLKNGDADWFSAMKDAHP